MSILFLKVLNMSLTASYVIIFVILIRLPLKKAPKFISYSLWGVVAFRLIVPFSFESIFSLIPRNLNSISIPRDVIYQQAPQVNSGIKVVDSFVSQIHPVPANISSANPLQTYANIGAYVWTLGIIALLVYSFVSILLLKRQLKSAELKEENVFEANNLKTPFVLGLIKPKIYLPSRIKDEERNYILLHEQIHIHRKDHVIKILAFFVLSIHWFNPLVWIAFILMSIDMELSCDERVLKEMNEDIKKPYANSLLSLAAGGHILNISPIAFSEGNLKGRIKNVLKFNKPKFYVTVLALLVLIVLFIGLLTNPKKDSKYFAKEFLNFVTAPDELESTRYYRDVFDSEGTGQYSIKEYGDSIKRDYGDLMTDKAFDGAISNRFLPWDILIREDIEYKVEVGSIDVKKMSEYKDGRVHYGYSISLRVQSSNGENESITVSGDIVMIEGNTGWLVDAFRWNSDYQNLYKLLLSPEKTIDEFLHKKAELYDKKDEILGENYFNEVDEILKEVKVLLTEKEYERLLANRYIVDHDLVNEVYDRSEIKNIEYEKISEDKTSAKYVVRYNENLYFENELKQEKENTEKFYLEKIDDRWAITFID